MRSPPARFAATAPFVPMAAASGPHAQTIFAALLRVPPVPQLRRERWDTPDGDFVDVDWVEPEREAEGAAPHVLVLHGLEGSSRSGYVLETLRAAGRRGFGAVALNFRSCSGEPNRTARSYNSGDITDALYVIDRMRQGGVTGPLYGVGFSLGASVLLNLLARTGASCPLEAGVAISAPFDLESCALHLDEARGLTRLYRELFVRSLKAKALRKTDDQALRARIRAVRGIRAFDDLVSAPAFGFASASEYYRACSTAPQLHAILRPTLIITSDDDPLAPASALPRDVLRNGWLSVLRTSRGGHVGFMSGAPSAPHFWAEEQAVAFLDSLRA